MGAGELFMLSVVVLGLLRWVMLLIGAFAAMWLLDEALSSVFVRRWRIYCMMLVDGLRGFVGLGSWFVCVALVVEGLFFFGKNRFNLA